MNGSVENVGINITSSTEQALASLRRLNAVLVSSNKQFENMNKQLDKIRGAGKGAGGGSFSSEMKDIADKTPRATKAVGSLLGVLARFVSLREVMRFLGRAFNEMSEFAENYNLFVVSLGEAKDEALQFQNAMNKALGTNMSQTMRYQGFFQNLTTALGATNEQGFLLSKTLTMLTYDMASLFNWSPDVAFQRLQSGIVGQTKPLRYAGVDVTQQTIQPILGELGIEKTVFELTQYEKVLLRMISILRQTGNAQGDFARTIESPANQIRILADQTKELYRWIGGTFIGLISQALPYINGFVMALVEVFKMLSYLVGFTEEDFDFMNGDGGEQFEEYEENVNGANEAVKKLTGNLRKFDEINNISMSSGAGGIGGGVSDVTIALLKELNKQAGYFDDTFANVKNKSRDIKENIMKWLSTFFELNEKGDAFTGKITGWGVALLGFTGLLTGGGAILSVLSFVKLLGDVGKFFAGGTSAKVATDAVAVGSSMSGAFLPVAVAIGAIIIVGGALAQLFTEQTERSKEFKDNIVSAWDSIKKSFQDVYNQVIKPIFDQMKETALDVWNNGFKTLWEGIVNFVAGAGNLATGIIEAFSKVNKFFIDTFGIDIVKTFTKIIKEFGALLNFFLEGTAFWLSVLGDFMTWVGDVFRGDWGKVLAGIGNLFTDLINFVIKGINFMLNAISKELNGWINLYNATLGQLFGKVSKVNFKIEELPKIKVEDIMNQTLPTIGGQRYPTPATDTTTGWLQTGGGDKTVVVTMDHIQVGKVLGTETKTGTPSLSW